MAPMTFLWNLIGLNPVYEIICGSAEVLGGILASPFTPAVLALTRTPTPDHYPLLERGFHFISEWRYER